MPGCAGLVRGPDGEAAADRLLHVNDELAEQASCLSLRSDCRGRAGMTRVEPRGTEGRWVCPMPRVVACRPRMSRARAAARQ